MARIRYVHLKHSAIGYLLAATLDPILTDCSTVIKPHISKFIGS